MTVLAGFQALLQRYSGQDLISVGTPVAGRGRAEAQHLIGSFVNTVVLRSDTSGNPSFRELLGRVRQTALEAYAHQDVPFELVVESLQLERDLSRNPLFQVMFVLQPDPLRELSLGELAASPIDVDAATARLDLLLSLWEGEHSLSGAVEYNSDLFDAGTVVRLLGHLQTLLEAVVADPDRRLLDVPILTAAERRRLLVDWNATAAPYEQATCMHQLFERRAAQAPDAIATIDDRGVLSYGELNRRANQLAHHLSTLGVGPGALVAVYMDRSSEMIVAVLGILKAGGAYVPLEVGFPLARVQWILESLGVRAIVTGAAQLDDVRALREHLPLLDDAICLDAAALPQAGDSTAAAARCGSGAAPTSIGCRTPIGRHAPLPATWPTSFSPRGPPARPKV